MTKIFLALSLVFLSGCATKYVSDLGSDKYLAVANDTDGLISERDSLTYANILAYQKCSGKSVVVENVSTKDDKFGMPETSIMFHCK